MSAPKPRSDQDGGDEERLKGLGVTMVSQSRVEEQVDKQLDAKSQLAAFNKTAKKAQRSLGTVKFQLEQEQATLSRLQAEVNKAISVGKSSSEAAARVSSLRVDMSMHQSMIKNLKTKRDKLLAELQQLNDKITELTAASKRSIRPQEQQAHARAPHVQRPAASSSSSSAAAAASTSTAPPSSSSFLLGRGRDTGAGTGRSKTKWAKPSLMDAQLSKERVGYLKLKRRGKHIGTGTAPPTHEDAYRMLASKEKKTRQRQRQQAQEPSETAVETGQQESKPETKAGNDKRKGGTEKGRRAKVKRRADGAKSTGGEVRRKRAKAAATTSRGAADSKHKTSAAAATASPGAASPSPVLGIGMATGVPLRAAAQRAQSKVRTMFEAPDAAPATHYGDDGGGGGDGGGGREADAARASSSGAGGGEWSMGRDDDEEGGGLDGEEAESGGDSDEEWTPEGEQGRGGRQRGTGHDHHDDDEDDDGEEDFVEGDEAGNRGEGEGEEGEASDAVGNDDEDDDDEFDEEEREAIKTSASYAAFCRARVHETRVPDDGDDEAYRRRIDQWRTALLQFIARSQQQQQGQQPVQGADADEGELVDGLYSASDFDAPPATVADGIFAPGFLWNKLYPYQHECLRWLASLHASQVGGVLGDEMGLGKTIQVIAFLAAIIYGTPSNTDASWFANARPSRRHIQRGSCGAVLVVCPATVVHHWVREFHKWWPHFRVCALHSSGSYEGRESLVQRIARGGPGHVLVTTYSTLRKSAVDILPVRWHYAVLDEGHKIRNPDAQVTLVAKQLRTEYRLLLTGTPIQNNLKELWSLFDFVHPGRLGQLPTFSSQFIAPMMAGSYANATEAQVQAAYRCACVLRDTIRPCMLHRAKDDVQAQISLPPRNEQILFCKLTEDQRALYEHYLASRDVGEILRGELTAFHGIDLLRKICNHPDLATSLADAPDYSDPNVPLPWQRSGKMIVLRQLLRLWHNKGHRVLLFCQTRQLLNMLESFIKYELYQYLRLDGTVSVKQRQPLIRYFNDNPDIFIFILTTRTGGLGLNLTGADRVIIFDPDWNPSVDVQAKERAWRIGQQKPVTIYRLLTAGTIEEKIYHRQVFKQLLTFKVMKDPRQRRFFKSSDLHELFVLGDSSTDTETGDLASHLSGQDVAITRASVGVGADDEEGGGKAKERRGERQGDGTGAGAGAGEEQPGKDTVGAREQAHAAAQPREHEEQPTELQDPQAGGPRSEQQQKKHPQEQGQDKRGQPAQHEEKHQQQQHQHQHQHQHQQQQQQQQQQQPQPQPPVGSGLAAEVEDIRDLPQLARVDTRVVRDELSKRKAPREKPIAKTPALLSSTTATTSTASKHGQPPSSSSSSSSSSAAPSAFDVKRALKDDFVLNQLFEGTGIHSALEHDRVMKSTASGRVISAREAEKMAKHAMQTLQREQEEARRQRIGTLTWTGRSGQRFGQINAGARFGKRFEPQPAASDSGGGDDGGDGEGQGDGGQGGSSSIMAHIKKRKQNLSAADASEFALPLLKELREFLTSKGGCASTKELLAHFNKRVAGSRQQVFVQLLHTLCSFSRVGSKGYWTLKPE